MSVDIGEIISTGFKRTFKRNGLILVGLLFIVNLFTNVVSQSFFSEFAGSMMSYGGTTGQMGSAYPLAFELPLTATAILYPVAVIASMIVGIGALRTLVSSETSKLPRENFTNNLLMPVLNLIFGGIVYSLLITVAFAVPLIPGGVLYLAGVSTIGLVIMILGGIVSLGLMTYLSTALFYWNVYVIVEDMNFIDGLKTSWNNTEGKRLKLFVAGFLVVLISMIAGFMLAIPGGIITMVTGTAAISTILNLAVSAFAGVFSAAAIAEAYRQISG